ncbi:hypothetical protein [Miniimonas arenae]|uniref:hypothetical protein n=1 Tax=Miniimonas arenae TaxID=676201 RepID=UPI0028AECC02|nr:hypothetical protein [Miniimonas arenae]
MTSTMQLATLSDIAELAGVQRPVVSVWRSRFTSIDQPFPVAIDRRGGREVFSLDDVVRWLESTGHGNNPSVRQDSALAAALDVLDPPELSTVTHGLIALLALKAKLGIAIGDLDARDLIDLADDVDPQDHCLYREIAALGSDVVQWAGHADALASAAFTPAHAMTKLIARHRRLGLTAVSDHTIAPAATALLGQLAAELVLGDPAAPLVAPYGEADLLLALSANTAEPGSVTLPTPHGPDTRYARRVLLAGGWEITDAVVDDDAVVLSPGATVLAVLPSATRPQMTDADVVATLLQIEADLPPDGQALVVGPASGLCAGLPTQLQADRATVLRSGRVRGIVRLPAGLWPSRARQKMGLWLLGPGTGDVRSPNHRVALADLSGTTLDAATTSDLVTDLLSTTPARASTHAFRFARLVQTTSVVAASGDLLTARPQSRRHRTDAATTAAALRDLLARADTGDDVSLTQWQVVPGEVAGPVLVTLGRLVTLGHLRLLSGNRLAEDDVVDEAGGVTVHTVQTLTAPLTGRRSIDRLHLVGTYPASRFTQAEDVVFCTAPRAAALVDRDGFSVVASPARVLRVTPSAPDGLVAEVVAHAVRTSPGQGDWRAWPVPILPSASAATVRAALAEVDSAREALATRLAALDALTAGLVEATSSGAVALLPPIRTTPMEG